MDIQPGDEIIYFVRSYKQSSYTTVWGVTESNNWLLIENEQDCTGAPGELVNNNHIYIWSKSNDAFKLGYDKFLIGKKCYCLYKKYVLSIKSKTYNLVEKTNSLLIQVGSSSIDGACCVKCGTFAVYANKGFTCYSCRSDPYRFSPLNAEDDFI